MVEKDFLSCGSRFLLFHLFFPKSGNFTEISGNSYFGGVTFFRQKAIFHPVKTAFFYSVLLFCKWKLLLKLVETSSLYFL